MKTILVDALFGFVIKDVGINEEMHKMLDTFPNKKIILTNANEEERGRFLKDMPYPVFSLDHNPNKTDSRYYRKMLEALDLKAEDTVYFEHDMVAVENAMSLGINTYFYDSEKKDVKSLASFLKANL